MSTENKIIVGSEEWCKLPQLGIPALKCRIDSGARTSSLHAFNIQPFHRDGNPWIAFEVHPIQADRRTSVHCESEVSDRRTVKSSNGLSERRYVIRSAISLGGTEWDIEITLTNRISMGYRMLIGREAMKGRMLVDPEACCQLGEPNKEELMRLYRSLESKNEGLNIALLATNPDLYSNRRLMEAGEERGHRMRFLSINQCYIRLDAHTPEIHYRGGRLLNDLHAVIPRIRPSATFYGCALTRQFESLGVYTLNRSSAISQSRDKLFSLQLLLQGGLNIPVTGFANSPHDTEDLIEMVGGAPLIVKLLEGTQGRGVVLAETRKASDSVINAFKSLRANLLVQEFIKEAKGRDLRLLVIDGKVVAAMQREAAPGEFRANIHRGGSAAAVKPTKEERRMAIKAARVLGLKVAGVDIIRSERGPLLLEVNSSPGLEGIETATGKDIADLMIEAIERKLAWKLPASDEIDLS